MRHAFYSFSLRSSSFSAITLATAKGNFFTYVAVRNERELHVKCDILHTETWIHTLRIFTLFTVFTHVFSPMSFPRCLHRLRPPPTTLGSLAFAPTQVNIVPSAGTSQLHILVI